jgi:hypothetical protein
MVITEILAGLGNQMFQYAAARALALRCDADLALDLSWFAKKKGSPREYGLHAFNLSVRIANESEIAMLQKGKEKLLARIARKIMRKRRVPPETFVKEPHVNVWWPGFENLRAPVYLRGYWQNERYFASAADEIRNDFTFPALPESAAIMARMIKQTPCAVSVHVRRGDYLHLAHFQSWILPDIYYRNAIRTIAEKSGMKPVLFVFGDEPDWIRENFDAHGCQMFVVDFPGHAVNPHHDMHLMSLCRYHIIAKSTFSWWGAWLSGEDSVVCAPEHWAVPERWMIYDGATFKPAKGIKNQK